MCLEGEHTVTSHFESFCSRIGGQKKNTLLNKDNRPHLHADAVEFVPNAGADGTAAATFGTLKVTGFLRGRTLNVNGLVHVPGLGDYQMSQIDKAVDGYKLDANRRGGADAEMTDGDEVQVLDRADPAQQTSLVKENVPDEMDAEQTFPTDEEIAAAQAETKRSKLVKRVPKGMSDYQACWIPDVEELDEDDEDDDDDDMDDDEDAESDFMSCKSDQESGDEFEHNEQVEEFDDVSVSEAPVNHEKYDEGMFCHVNTFNGILMSNNCHCQLCFHRDRSARGARNLRHVAPGAHRSDVAG